MEVGETSAITSSASIFLIRKTSDVLPCKEDYILEIIQVYVLRTILLFTILLYTIYTKYLYLQTVLCRNTDSQLTTIYSDLIESAHSVQFLLTRGLTCFSNETQVKLIKWEQSGDSEMEHFTSLFLCLLSWSIRGS